MKEPIKIGQCTMFAETVHVPVIFDEVYLTHKDRVTIVDVNDIFLVIREDSLNPEPNKRTYKAFVNKADAFGYLELMGIERE